MNKPLYNYEMMIDRIKSCLSHGINPARAYFTNNSYIEVTKNTDFYVCNVISTSELGDNYSIERKEFKFFEEVENWVNSKEKIKLKDY